MPDITQIQVGSTVYDIRDDTVRSEVDAKLNAKANSSHTYDDRYYTESEVDTKLNAKANSSHTHDDRYYTESEVDTKLTAVDTKLNAKANSSHTHDDRYYTESEVDTKLNAKANSSHTHDDRYYTESEVDTKLNAVDTKLNAKANSSHTHDDRYYTESEVDTKLNAKANSSHTHDDRYYTKAEINTNLVDTGWETLQNSSVFLGSIYYRKIGNCVEVFGANLVLQVNITTSNLTLCTLNSKYSPHGRVAAAAYYRSACVMCLIYPGGDIYVNSTTDHSTGFSSGGNLYFNAVYYT